VGAKGGADDSDSDSNGGGTSHTCAFHGGSYAEPLVSWTDLDFPSSPPTGSVWCRNGGV
jgi:hypothetical protein